IITEPTHIYHTVGEHGLTEIGLQARPFEAIEESLKFLEEKGLIELKDERLKNIKDKIKGFNDDGCGYGKIENLRIGDNFYTLSAEHKPGSSTPSSDIPILGMIRRQSMNDITDIKFEGHLHVGYTGIIPKKDNSISLHLKGMTFNEYDSYGKMRGWSPATVGYIELEVPKTKGSKGAYKITYVTSENLV
ncbi:MAG: hypothetical protein J7L45_02385, partial [Candidatus Aenigmarchaeota archaeon]|nr:hypothetical protein [Candidatus Aenigmarchaeota archaeon]